MFVNKLIKYDLFIFISCCFQGPPLFPQIGLWTFEPAFSPRFSFPLSPRSFFHTGQRFPISNHVTSGCMSPPSFFHTGQRFPISNHVTSGCMSPPSHLDHWSAVTPTGNDMTSLICSRPIRSLHLCHTGVLYYLYGIDLYKV